MGFEEGDVVVAPGCGVGLIEDIEGVELGEQSVQMYKIVLESSGVCMWVPTHRAVVEGIRRPMAMDAVDEVLQIIRDTVAPVKRANWNRRQRRYRDLLMSNDPKQLAELLGELASVKADKTLSFGERQMFERARGLLESELVTVDEAITPRFEEALAA